MDIVVVSGFGAAIGLGMPSWALAKDAKTETDTMPTGTTTRAMDRNIKNRTTDREICSNLCAMPYPCAGSNETICKISMSSVPCGIGNRDGAINTSTFYRSGYSIIGRRSRHRFEDCLAIRYGCLDI
jgi:hypothetical protein